MIVDVGIVGAMREVWVAVATTPTPTDGGAMSLDDGAMSKDGGASS